MSALPHLESLQQIRRPEVNTEGLAQALRNKIQGEVRFDDGSRSLYATDSSNYRQIPIGVVIPRHAQDVIETIKLCHQFGAPMLSRGGGTSLAGQCCNWAVVMDMSKYFNNILEINAEERWARVEPGLILDSLRHKVETMGLTFCPDPATHDHCTLGGMIGNNSCGTHALISGRTSDNVIELEIVTYDGLRFTVGPTDDKTYNEILMAGGRRAEIYRQLKTLGTSFADEIRKRYPKIPRRVSGYNLDELLPEKGFNLARALVGTESTCITILSAKVQLVPNPDQRVMVILGYPDIFQAADHVVSVCRFKPIACEALDDRLVDYMKKKGLHPDDVKMLPEGKGWLVVEFGSKSLEDAKAQAHGMMAKLKTLPDAPNMKFVDDKNQQKKIWEVRESGLGATAYVPGLPDTWEGWEDSAVPPERLGEYLRAFKKLLHQHGYECSLYGHFGQGCLHCRINFDLLTHEGVANYRSFVKAAAELVVSFGGSLSGEHGDGQSRAEFLPIMFGDAIVGAFKEFKMIWDPLLKMNPGKIVDPYRVDENLRLGPHYNPPPVSTHFHYTEDNGNVAHASIRCVGVGKCRRIEVSDESVMCPSFLVTREEKHSTRGRAHLFFEMLRGHSLLKGWRDPHVKEALDLCLACKGCKHDCPVNVDLATYKAEFLSHYYKGRLRPRSAYAMGGIYWFARLASLFPRLVNGITQAPLLGNLLKWLGGISQKRSIPKFAPQTFRQWFKKRTPGPTTGKRVLLWADTFNNHFNPQVAQAAVEVLEAAGFDVEIPKISLCCGRPLYDFGFLNTAKRLLLQILETLDEPIASGVPVVGLEPSCTAVFKDELTNLFPYHEHAKRLSKQTFLLSEFLVKKAPHLKLTRLHQKALMQGHCHHKSIFTLKDEKKCLEDLGVDFEVINSSCCGMAGSFGFESQHYAISMQIGEQMVFPAVRKAAKDTMIIADGFSCRSQIEQGTARKVFHFSEVVRMALKKEKIE